VRRESVASLLWSTRGRASVLLATVVEPEVVLLQIRIVSKLAREMLEALHGELQRSQDESTMLRWRGRRRWCDLCCSRRGSVQRQGGYGRTKSSSALGPNVAFLGDCFSVADMSINLALAASLLNSASNVERNGLRDIGLPSALEAVFSAGDGIAGDAARLRNGLLEDKFSERPGEGRRSVDKGGYQRILFSSPAPYL
jgi:hypothetical protein